MILCVCSVGLMFGMMIDIGPPKFYSTPPPPMSFVLKILRSYIIDIFYSV